MSSPPDMNAGNVAALAAHGGAGARPEGAERASRADWLCRLGDDALVLGHRISEWCGRGPALEEDIALANVALDLIGHARMWLGLAAEAKGSGTADDLAFLRDDRHFRNALLVELPGDLALLTMRQFLFDAYHLPRLEQLARVPGPVAEVAAKAVKEVAYHLERSSDLVVRLGDGTEESHDRMQAALDRLWPYCGELTRDDAVDEGMPPPSALRPIWEGTVRDVLGEATLRIPEAPLDAQGGGRAGRHTEHLGPMLALMQVLPRSHPGAVW